MAFPLLRFTGASSLSVLLIFSLRTVQSCNCSPIIFKDSFLLFSALSFIGIMAFNEFFNNTTSRGFTLPVATFETKRSKSLICLI